MPHPFSRRFCLAPALGLALALALAGCAAPKYTAPVAPPPGPTPPILPLDALLAQAEPPAVVGDPAASLAARAAALRARAAALNRATASPGT